MRLFIAIDFNRELKKKIVDLQSGLKDVAVSGRWKHIDNFHLTLKFLGEVKPEDIKCISDINEKLTTISTRYKPFKLKFSSIDYFPGKDNIRVLWLGLEGDIDILANLQVDIDRQMVDIGFIPEKRKYVPHITIGQDVILKSDFQKLKERVNFNEIPEITVKDISLFKSEQISNRRVYKSIYNYEFI